MVQADFSDITGFEAANRGLIGSMVPCVVTNDRGGVVSDNDAYSLLDQMCPATANPSLWRHSQPCAKPGLYEVTDGIYQVRVEPIASKRRTAS